MRGGDFFRSVGLELRKMLKSGGFWLSVALILLILFTYGIYQDDSGKSYSVINVLLQLNHSTFLDNQLSAQGVFRIATQSGLAMYGTAFAALSFTGTFCQESRNNAKRYIVFRNGKTCFTLSKAVAAMVVSGLAFALAASLFMVVVIICFPDISQSQDYGYWLDNYSRNSSGEVMGIYKALGAKAVYLLHISGMFFYGCVCGAVGFAFSAFSSSIYLCVCIPFFIGYAQYSFFAGIVMGYTDGRIPEKVFSLICDYGAWQSYTAYWINMKVFAGNLGIMVLMWILAIVIFRARIGRSVDCGVKA